jgi:putative endopeptidase
MNKKLKELKELISTDFYSFVNNAWLKKTTLPPYEDSFGVCEEIELSLREKLMHTINTTRRENPSSNISILANSFLNTSVQKNSVFELQRTLNTFDCIRSSRDLAETIGKLNKIQSNSPICCVINNDYQKSTKCCVYLYESALILGSSAYYTTGTINRTLSKYRTVLKKLGELLNIEDLPSVITIETTLANKFLSNNDTTDDIGKLYNPMNYDELCRIYPSIEWEPLFSAWGLDNKTRLSSSYIITNVKYYHEINKMFRSFPLDMWRVWLRAMVIFSFIKYLPPPYDDLHYLLFERTMRGNIQKLPQQHLTLQVLMKYTPQDLSRMFVDLCVPKDTKKHATRLIKMLCDATKRRIMGLEWMEESTRAVALRKIDNMVFQIAYPDKWKSETADTIMDIKKPLVNIFTLASNDTKRMIDDLKHSTCSLTANSWNSGAFEVNAYYYPEGNVVTIPAGILRDPFFSLDKSDAWNLGGIGAVVGHEITHAFDTEGRLFDDKGNYRDWWSASDERTYKRMSQNVIDLYDGEKYMKGKVDGLQTVSENIADLGGIAIALDALNSIIPKKANNKDKQNAYRDFFTSYATSWRQKDRRAKAKHALLFDVHAPAKVRVNTVVKQFQEFYDTFEITGGDDGFIAPEERVSFW